MSSRVDQKQFFLILIRVDLSKSAAAFAVAFDF
jgi:hypothetical protein